MMKFIWAAVICLGMTSPVFATDLTIEDIWARASAGKMARAGAAFLTIKNTGETDKLIAAKADVSKTVELHTHIEQDGIYRMRQVDYIEAAKGMTMLKPGGYHVMFMRLHKPFEEGQTFPLTLVFEKAGEVSVNVTVKKAGAMGHGKGHGHGHMKHN